MPRKPRPPAPPPPIPGPPARSRQNPADVIAETQAEARGAAGGLRCPDCGCADLRVYYTRDDPRGRHRSRICRHCGRQVVTHEHVVGGGLADHSAENLGP